MFPNFGYNKAFTNELLGGGANMSPHITDPKTKIMLLDTSRQNLNVPYFLEGVGGREGGGWLVFQLLFLRLKLVKSESPIFSDGGREDW